MYNLYIISLSFKFCLRLGVNVSTWHSFEIADDDSESLQISDSWWYGVRFIGNEAVDKIVSVRSLREISTFASIEFDSKVVGVNGSDARKDLYSLEKKTKNLKIDYLQNGGSISTTSYSISCGSIIISDSSCSSCSSCSIVDSSSVDSILISPAGSGSIRENSSKI